MAWSIDLTRHGVGPVRKDEAVLAYVYRVTKYNPADRDGHGHYTGPEDTVSDHGEVEAAYLQAVAAFAAGTGIDHLVVREPQVPSLAHLGVEAPVDGFGLEGLFPSGQAGFHDGAQVLLDIALELVRVMLRDSGAWCRLEAEDTFAVHVGWDQYLYISSSRPCEEALARTRELGLFPERLDASPYAFESEEEKQDIQRPGVSVCLCVLLSCPTTTESYGLVGGPSRRQATATGHSVSPNGERSDQRLLSRLTSMAERAAYGCGDLVDAGRCRECGHRGAARAGHFRSSAASRSSSWSTRCRSRVTWASRLTSRSALR